MAQAELTLETAVPVAGRSQLMRQRARSAWLFLPRCWSCSPSSPAGRCIRTIYFSFTNASLTDLDARQWVGFANYFSVLQMPSGRGHL